MFGSLESILRWLKSSCCILRIAQWELIFPNFLHEVISSMSYFTQPKTQNLRLLADYLRKYKFIQFSENLLSLFINEVACKSSFFFFFFLESYTSREITKGLTSEEHVSEILELNLPVCSFMHWFVHATNTYLDFMEQDRNYDGY